MVLFGSGSGAFVRLRMVAAALLLALGATGAQAACPTSLDFGGTGVGATRTLDMSGCSDAIRSSGLFSSTGKDAYQLLAVPGTTNVLDMASLSYTVLDYLIKYDGLSVAGLPDSMKLATFTLANGAQVSVKPTKTTTYLVLGGGGTDGFFYDEFTFTIVSLGNSSSSIVPLYYASSAVKLQTIPFPDPVWTKGPDHALPAFQPSRRFDIELEIGAVVGVPSEGPVTVAEADDMIFGYVLLNDWSARDIQAWEYQPLGPFQAKATATTISPWIVMKAALEPFRVPTPPREVPLLPYLHEPRPMLYDIALEVALRPEGGAETVIARTNYAEMYYSAPQQLAHHTTSGCAMNTGDLLGSGTISGPTRDSRGSLLELSWGGKEPVAIDGGTRTFIEDNDTLTLRGQCKGAGYAIGFGDCAGKVIPALADPYAR